MSEKTKNGLLQLAQQRPVLDCLNDGLEDKKKSDYELWLASRTAPRGLGHIIDKVRKRKNG